MLAFRLFRVLFADLILISKVSTVFHLFLRSTAVQGAKHLFKRCRLSLLSLLTSLCNTFKVVPDLYNLLDIIYYLLAYKYFLKSISFRYSHLFNLGIWLNSYCLFSFKEGWQLLKKTFLLLYATCSTTSWIFSSIPHLSETSVL